MRKVLTVLLVGLLGGLGLRASAQDEAEGYMTVPASVSSLPATYKDYAFLLHGLSPDKKYGFIYPKRSILDALDGGPDPKLFLVALKPFRMLSEVPSSADYLTTNHGYFFANWAKDSSAVTVIDGSKWGPDKVILVPIHNGEAGKIVNLTDEVKKVVKPDFDKVKPEPYNTDYDFIFDSENRVIIDKDGEMSGEKGWDINDKGQVIVDATCATNPKHDSGTKSWECTFQGIWDIAQGKWVRKKFERTFSGEYKEEQ